MARNSQRIGAIAALSAAFALVSLPALAATDDVWATKSNDSGGLPVADGETVNYTIDMWNPSGTTQHNLEVRDTMDPGLVYVPESTLVKGTLYQFGEVAFDNLPAEGSGTDYDFDTGVYWADNWTEVNDGASLPDSGFVRRSGSPLDADAIGLTGLASAPATALENPGITRTIDPANLVDLVDAHMNFQTHDQNLTADDKLGVWVSTDGGTTWSAPTTYDGVGGVDNKGFSLQSFLPATSLMLRFGVAAGDYPSDATWDDNDALWTIDDISIEALYGYEYGYDNIPGSGYANLQNGAPAALILPTDNLDLPAKITYHGVDHISEYTITYAATVDTSATVNYDTVLNNLVKWRTNTYPGVETNEWGDAVTVEYDPKIDLVVSSNGPLHVGEPVLITLVLKHGVDSDGSPVCADDLDYPIGGSWTSWTGDDGDECIEAGEIWTVVLTYPPYATTGTFAFSGTFFGTSVNQGEGDEEGDITVTAGTEITVVLAETGAQSGWLAGVSAALIALGATALVVARRRTA